MRTVAKGSWRRWAVGLAVVGLAFGVWGLLVTPSALAQEGGGEPGQGQEATLFLKGIDDPSGAAAATPWAGTRYSPTTLLCGQWTSGNPSVIDITLTAWKNPELTDPEGNVTWGFAGGPGRWVNGNTGHEVHFEAQSPGVYTFTATTPDCSETIDVIFARTKLVEHLEVDEEGTEDPSYILCDSDGDFPFKFEIDGIGDGLVWVADDASAITLRFWLGAFLNPWDTVSAHLFASSWEATECDNGEAKEYCFTVTKGDMADVHVGAGNWTSSADLDVVVDMTVRRGSEETNVATVTTTASYNREVENVRYANSICRTIHICKDEPLASGMKPSDDYFEYRASQGLPLYDENFESPDPGFVESPGDIACAYTGLYAAHAELMDDEDWYSPANEVWRATSVGGGPMNYALVNFGLKESPFWGTYLDVTKTQGGCRPEGWAPANGTMVWTLAAPNGGEAYDYRQAAFHQTGMALSVIGLAASATWVGIPVSALGILCSVAAEFDSIDDSDERFQLLAQATFRWGWGKEVWAGDPIAIQTNGGGGIGGPYIAMFRCFPYLPGDYCNAKVGDTFKAFVEWAVCAQNQSYFHDPTPTASAYIETNVETNTMNYVWQQE